MKHPKCILAFYVLILGVSSLFAQTPASDAQQTPPADPPKWTVGGLTFDGFVDGYYNLNFNHPASGSNSGVRTFDARANTFSLNMAKIGIAHDAEPIGFRLDLGFGRGFEIFHAFEPLKDSTTINRNIYQAYVSVKPENWGGLQFDFGKFVTSAGAEPTESHLNFNYSRSLIYSLGPFYHFGARVSKPVNDVWTTGFQVVNGWNNVDDNNSGKTVGIINAFNWGKVAYFNNYYVGPEKTGTNQKYRHFIDQVLSLSPNDKTSIYFNYDYGYEKDLDGAAGIISAFGAAARFQANNWFAVSPRIEYYNDRGTWTSGTIQKLKEFTLTAEAKHSKGFLTRLEYRRDWSNVPFFDRGNQLGNAKSQNTIAIAFIAVFGE
jgi:hypothetical protein